MPSADTVAVERLIQLTRTGDPAARRELAAQACDRLRALTRTMLRADFARVRRWEETDDVYQNAVLRLHRALAEMTPESAVHFYRLAALQVRRELLSLAEHYYGPQGAGANHHTDGHPADGGGSTLPTVPAAGDGPETIAEWTDFHTAAGKLPNEEREVFDLIWYQGLSQDEAAVVLNVSTRTVKRRWQEAKLWLHRLLGGQEPGG
jgi:RNA polymerase sigma-70 factor (ECF subfamily)